MAEQGGRRQLVKFTFFKVDPAWRRLDPATRAESKRAFVAALEEATDLPVCRTYSTIGTRGDCDFMIWAAAYEDPLKPWTFETFEARVQALKRYVADRNAAFLGQLAGPP